MEHYSWTHIEAFKNVCRYVEIYQKDHKPTVKYQGKIKLHGTNAAVQINENGVFAQSRNKIISPEDDNVGFATWLEDKKEAFKQVHDLGHRNLAEKFTTIIYGEWAGPGIMKGTSVSKIDRRIFAIFALRTVFEDGQDYVNFNPDWLEKHMKPLASLEDVFILPWSTDVITCDFNDRQSLLLESQKFNEYVEKVEELDPWVKETFGVEGNGEGYVFYPIGGAINHYDEFSHFIFKAKGNKHRKDSAEKKVFAKISAETLSSITEFLDMFVTIDRLEQGVTEACNGEFDIRRTNKFLTWIRDDIQREGLAELEANNLTWKQVAKEITNRARSWWKAKCNELFSA